MGLLPLYEFIHKERKSSQTLLVIKIKFGQWPNVSHLSAALKALDPVILQSVIYDQTYSRHSVPQSSRDTYFLFQQNRSRYFFFL